MILLNVCVLSLLLFFGCPDPAIEQGTGNLIIQIPTSSPKSIPVYTPSIPMQNVSFSVSGSGPSEASFSSEIFTATQKVFDDLSVGLWEITISGYNSEGVRISSCTFQTIIRKNQVTTEVVQLAPLVGIGVLNFSIDWEDPSEIMTDPQVQLSFESGNDLSVKKIVQIPKSVSNSALSAIALENGWYLVTASLFEGSPLESGNIPWWQGTYSLRIVSEQITEISMSIPEIDIIKRGTGTSSIIVQEDMKNEFSVEFSGNMDSIFPGDTITLSASTDHSSSAQYRWYVNGDLQVGINQRTLDYQFLTTGRYDIALFVIDNGSINGYNDLFTVVNPIPVEQIIIVQGDSLAISTGLSVQLNASLSPSDATIKDIVWSSSDNTLAEVDQDGLVTIKKEGLFTITANALGGSDISDTCEITSAFASIGDTGQAGGKIFYVDTENIYPDWTYLEFASNIIYPELPWGDYDRYVSETQFDMGMGKANTERIILYFGRFFYNFMGYDNYAAKYCDELNLNGYDDWYLPSYDELKALSEHAYSLGLWGLGNGRGTPAWSSTADDKDNAYMWYLVSKTPYSWARFQLCLAIPIRKY